MNLRNIHNVTYVAVYEQGDVKMTGLDGDANIFVKKVFISNFGCKTAKPDTTLFSFPGRRGLPRESDPL